MFRKSSYSGGANCVEVDTFRKSSYSAYNGNCVEVDTFRKSSHSDSGAGNNCVEVASAGGVRVRDSKPGGPAVILQFTGVSWGKFTTSIKAGTR